MVREKWHVVVAGKCIGTVEAGGLAGAWYEVEQWLQNLTLKVGNYKMKGWRLRRLCLGDTSDKLFTLRVVIYRDDMCCSYRDYELIEKDCPPIDKPSCSELIDVGKRLIEIGKEMVEKLGECLDKEK